MGRAIPDRFPRSLMFSMTASVPSYTPMASPEPHIAVLVRASRHPNHPDDESGIPIGSRHSSTTARPIHQVRQAADDSRDVNHWFSFLTPVPSLLAGTNHLVVSVRPYVVEAAPSLTPNPGLGLPPASTGHCDDRRRAPPPAITSAPRGARDFSSTHNTIADSGGSRYSPTTSHTLFTKNGSVDSSNSSLRYGCNRNAFQTHPIEDFDSQYQRLLPTSEFGHNHQDPRPDTHPNAP